MTTATVRTTLDVRAFAPRERQPPIFMTFGDLASRAAFMRVNDHDPESLYCQSGAVLGPISARAHVESGPETGRATVRRNVT